MSDIWELKPQISECSLQINVVHHSPYHMKWIWYSLHQALGIFLQILHAISKHQLCCSIFYIKTFSKVVPSFDGVVWPFGNLFVSFFCAFGYLTFLSFVRETFLILWNVKRGIFLRLLFIAVFWYLIQCFAVFLIVEVFTLIIVMSKAIACIWKSFRLVVFSCLYRSWSIFYPELIRV